MTARPDIRVIDQDDAAYPRLLRRIANPPKKLYCRGDLRLLSASCVAVVGARKATEYGEWVSFNLAKDLAAQGVVIVSGMAAGVDARAHSGALAAGGKTIAVLGCGVDVCYPRSGRALMDEIAQKGLLVSELPPGTHPTVFTFPLRNRIISGLSLATVIAEAGMNSGSLITAERAAEQGREVYAVPGNINRASSFGCNKLIRDGATPIAVLSDVAADLRLARPRAAADAMSAPNADAGAFAPPVRDDPPLGADEKRILSEIRGGGELTFDALCRLTGLTARDVAGIVTVLEMKGLVESAMGRVFATT